nr:hypothetical protein [Candidatus Woesearchaeota archaeon]
MEKIIRSLRNFDSDIEREGLNLNERFCFYSGIISGALIPVIATRSIMPRSFGSEGILQEATLLGLSAIVSLPFSAYGTLAGACFGSYAANKIKNKRIEEERSSEQAIELRSLIEE